MKTYDKPALAHIAHIDILKSRALENPDECSAVPLPDGVHLGTEHTWYMNHAAKEQEGQG